MAKTWFQRRRSSRRLPPELRNAPLEAYEYHHPAFGPAPERASMFPLAPADAVGRFSQRFPGAYVALLRAEQQRRAFEAVSPVVMLQDGAFWGPDSVLPEHVSQFQARSEHGVLGARAMSESELPADLVLRMQRGFFNG